MISHIHKTILLALITLVTLLLPANSQNQESNLILGKNLYDQTKYPEALEVINRVLAVDSSKAEPYMLRANIYFKLKQYDNTINDCYKVLRIEPNLPDVYMLRGKVCVVTESYGGAILFFGKAIQYTSDNSLLFEAFLNRGAAYLKLKKYYDAKSNFESAYTINPDSPELLLLMADNQLQLHETDKAMNSIMEVIGADPENAKAHEIMGRIAVEKKDFKLAIVAYTKLCTLIPGPESYYKLADAHFRSVDYTNAMHALNKAISLDPGDPAPYKLKGIIYIEQGNKELGCDHLFQAMQLGYFEKYGYDLLEIYLRLCEEMK
jgi:tetratricopeptide (TPR) repeat protein